MNCLNNLLALSCMALNSIAPQGDELPYTVEGYMQNRLYDSTTVILRDIGNVYCADSSAFVDSATVIGGRFEFTGFMDRMPRMAALYIPKSNIFDRIFILQPGRTTFDFRTGVAQPAIYGPPAAQRFYGETYGPLYSIRKDEEEALEAANKAKGAGLWTESDEMRYRRFIDSVRLMKKELIERFVSEHIDRPAMTAPMIFRYGYLTGYVPKYWEASLPEKSRTLLKKHIAYRNDLFDRHVLTLYGEAADYGSGRPFRPEIEAFAQMHRNTPADKRILICIVFSYRQLDHDEFRPSKETMTAFGKKEVSFARIIAGYHLLGTTGHDKKAGTYWIDAFDEIYYLNPMPYAAIIDEKGNVVAQRAFDEAFRAEIDSLAR